MFAQLLGATWPHAAQARGFVSFHFGVGVPLVVGPPAVYYPPPVYYYPPPPPPVFYTPAPSTSAASADASSQQVCHEYQTTALIDGKPQPVFGRACLQPDGSWRIAN
jgi:hypothetical protein